MPGTGRAFVIILVLMGAVFLLRMATPDDLRNRDQVKVCAYILDAAYNGNWICQVDSSGDITSKPPLYNWLGALMVLLFGANRFSYALPAFFGTLLAAFVVWRWALDLVRDERSAWLAVLCYLATNAAVKQVALVRTDGLFTGLVALCAWQVWRAWETDRGWWRAWFFAALAALTKGPFAILLGFGGLSAIILWRGTGLRKRLPRGWWYGLVIPVMLAGGWALVAWYFMGHAFYNKIFVKELWAQSVGGGGNLHRLVSAIRPPLYLISRAFPWSPFFIWALWRVFRTPAPEPGERRGERFIVAHVGIGLLALMLASHKRGDLVFPLLPAMAVLEGRMLGVLSRSWNWYRLKAVLASFTLFLILFEVWYLEVPRLHNDMVALGLSNKAYAERLEKDCGEFFPFCFKSAPDLQYRLGVTRLDLTVGQVKRLLAGPEAVFILTQKLPGLLSKIPGDVKCFMILRDPNLPYGVISNRPDFSVDEDMAVASRSWELHTCGVVVRRMRGTTAWIEPGPGGQLTLSSRGRRTCTLRLILPDGRSQKIHAEAGSSVVVSFP